jgi:hypothetical protein
MVGYTPDSGAGHAMTPYEIYQKITSGPGTDTLQRAQHMTDVEAKAESRRGDLLNKLTGMIQDGWEGSASESAYGSTKPLVETADSRSVHLRFAQLYMQDQITAFGTAKNSVRPVTPAPPPTNVLAEAVPWLGDLDSDTKAYQNDAQNNITVFSAYDTASSTNGQRMPTEYPVYKDQGGAPDVVLADQPQAGSSSNATSGDSHSQSVSGVPSVPSGSTGTPSGGPASPQQGGHPITQGPQAPGGSTSASSATPPPVYRPGTGAYPQAPAAQGPSTVSPNEPFGPYGGTGYGPGSSYGRGYGGGSGYGGGYGARSGSGAGVGAGGRSGAGPEGGPRAGAGAMPAEEALGRRAGAVGATRGGISGMGGMGAGHGGGKDEDTEHERPSFLQEDDPEDIFGTDEVTAPSVIE